MGVLLWELEDYGTTMYTEYTTTIASDLSFNFDATYNSLLLELNFTFFGEQDSKLLWELADYTVE